MFNFLLFTCNEIEAKVWDLRACLHLASGSLVSDSVLWLKPCYDFDSLFFIFYFFFLLHFSCCFAWLPCLAHPNIHLSFTPPPSPIAPSNPLPLTSPTPPPPIPEQTAVSDRRGAWEVQPARQANSSYLTSHLTADRHGGSVQVYTPHLINPQPLPSLHGVRSVSNNPNRDKYTFSYGM